MKSKIVKLVLLLATGGTLALFSHALAAPPDQIVLDAYKKAKPAVKLDHKKHAEIVNNNCIECHHKWDKASGKEPQKCGDCHKAKKEGNTPSIKSAFHKNCKDCHKKNKAKGAPTSCKGCHK